MVKQGDIIKHVIGTVILCLSLLMFTMPSTAASSMTEMSAMQHQMQMDDAASDHCTEMQSSADSVKTDDECCEDGTCQCIHPASSVATTLISPARIPDHSRLAAGGVAIISMVDQFFPSINQPPII